MRTGAVSGGVNEPATTGSITLRRFNASADLTIPRRTRPTSLSSNGTLHAPVINRRGCDERTVDGTTAARGALLRLTPGPSGLAALRVYLTCHALERARPARATLPSPAVGFANNSALSLTTAPRSPAAGRNNPRTTLRAYRRMSTASRRTIAKSHTGTSLRAAWAPPPLTRYVSNRAARRQGTVMSRYAPASRAYVLGAVTF